MVVRVLQQGRSCVLKSLRVTDGVVILYWALYDFEQERELAKLVLEGLSNVEIAKRLFLSPHTVGDHIKAILEKVGTHSKRELIAGLLKGAVRQTADLSESERR